MVDLAAVNQTPPGVSDDAATDSWIIEFGGAELHADRSGALWWPAEATLLVADLHLEKGSGYASRGQMLPPYDSGKSLARLADLVATHNPAKVICLGDSFHDRGASGRLPNTYRTILRGLMDGRDWLWISGNHDPNPPDDLGGKTLLETEISGIVLRHEAHSRVRPEISGHFHPKASVRVRYHRVTGRCFVFDERRLILPAFGAYTGGLSVRSPEIKKLLGTDAQVVVIGARRMFGFPLDRLA